MLSVQNCTICTLRIFETNFHADSASFWAENSCWWLKTSQLTKDLTLAVLGLLLTSRQVVLTYHYCNSRSQEENYMQRIVLDSIKGGKIDQESDTKFVDFLFEIRFQLQSKVPGAGDKWQRIQDSIIL